MRRLLWTENELVYSKADKNAGIAGILAELEEMALKEAEESCGILRKDGKPITREMVLGMPERDKERIMWFLSDAGLQEFNPSITEGKITVTFTPHIQKVLGCTMFSVLNYLEKLDGAINVLFPEVRMELRVPLGAKKGMAKCEMLMLLLYPWLVITETSTNAVSDTLNMQSPISSGPQAESASPESQITEQAEVPKEKKKGFSERVFGKK